MIYLVKHGEADYRAHQSDGEVVAEWSWEKDWLTERTDAMVSDLNSSVDEKYRYRDMTRNDESVTW